MLFFVVYDVCASTKLDSTVVAVDAKNFLQRLEDGRKVAQQAAFADFVPLNMVDPLLVGEAVTLEARTRVINPMARLHRIYRQAGERAARS
jgi:G3E family GTPase